MAYKNPALNIALQNIPGNLFDRVSALEAYVQSLNVAETPPIEQLQASRLRVIDLDVFPAAGVTVTNPLSTSYIGGFISGEGLDFGTGIYNFGGVNAGVVQVGINTIDGTLYAINANISGVFTVGAGSTAGGWVIDASSIHDAAGTVGLSSAVTGGNDLRIWAGDAVPVNAPFRVYEDGSLVSTFGAIGGWTIGSTTIQDTAGLTGLSSAVTGGNDIRFWAGHATPTSAPFQVYENGAVTASSITISGTSTIAGWNIDATRIYKFSTGSTGVILDSSTPAIKVGNTAGTYILVDGANQVIKSSNYSAGLIGSAWTTSTGDAEFNNITARGTLKVTAIQASTVMAHGGTDWIVPAVGVLRDDCTSVDSPTTFAVNVKDPNGITHAASGTLWTVGDRIRLKEPLTGDLWASISSLTDNTTYWTLNVVKQSPGTATNYTFRAGLAIIDYGVSGSGFIALSADTSVGSTPNITMATHAGSPWTTFTNLIRIGNLNGAYGYASNVYGIGMGSYGVAGQPSMTVDTTNGIRIISNTTTIGQWDASGNIVVGQVAASQNNILLTSGALSIRNNTTVIANWSNTGVITVGEVGASKSNTIISAGDFKIRLNTTSLFNVDTSGNLRIGTDTSTASTTRFFVSNASQTYNSEAGYVAGDVLFGDNTSASNKGNVLITNAGVVKIRRGVTDYITLSSTDAQFTNVINMSGSSAAIAIGSTPPTSATVGTGLWVDRTGVYSLSSNIQNATLSSSGLSAGGGAVVLDKNGQSFSKLGVFFLHDTGNVIGGMQMIAEKGMSWFGMNYAALTVSNSGFEAALAGTWATISGTPESSTDQAQAGTHSLKLNALNEGVRSNSFITISGGSGGVDFWVYQSVDNILFTVAIECYTAGGASLGDANATVQQITNGGIGDNSRWQRYVFIGDYLATTAKVKIRITVDQASTIYFDTIRMLDGNGFLMLGGTNPGVSFSDAVGSFLGISATGNGSFGTADIGGALTAGSLDVFGDIAAEGRLKANTFFSLGAGGNVTIASDAITITGSRHRVETEAGAATDNLSTINGGSANDILVLSTVNSAHDVTVKDGVGNIFLAGDFVMDTVQDTLTLIKLDSTNWLELMRSNNS